MVCVKLKGRMKGQNQGPSGDRNDLFNRPAQAFQLSNLFTLGSTLASCLVISDLGGWVVRKSLVEPNTASLVARKIWSTPCRIWSQDRMTGPVEQPAFRMSS